MPRRRSISQSHFPIALAAALIAALAVIALAALAATASVANATVTPRPRPHPTCLRFIGPRVPHSSSAAPVGNVVSISCGTRGRPSWTYIVGTKRRSPT